MISSKANVILMDKNRLEEDLAYLLSAEEKIELTLRSLKYQDNVKFGDVEMSLELIHAVIAYIKALRVRRDAIATIKLKVNQ
jgi:hypothetical protein